LLAPLAAFIFQGTSSSSFADGKRVRSLLLTTAARETQLHAELVVQHGRAN
jgi:hypothetical protein